MSGIMGKPVLKKLFEPGSIGSVDIKNRIVMAPVGTEFWGVNGEVTERLIDHYSSIAKGGVGLITISFASVDYPPGYGILGSLYSKAMLSGHYSLVEKIHVCGAKASLQLMHRGRQVHYQRGLDIVSSSPVKCYWLEETPLPTPRALDVAEIFTIIEHYATIAGNAKRAGYDMVEIHAAHGYLINSFISPYLNTRDDEFGGSVENRMRFPTELLKRLKKEVGEDFPIGFRISGDEFVKGGTTIEESPIIARILQEAGAAFIHVSSGLHETAHKCSDVMRLPEGWKSYIWKAIKKAVTIPVIAAGGNRNPEFCETVLQNGECDFIALGRPLLADPDWPRKASEGKYEDIRRCISCLECLGPMTGRAADTRCAVNVRIGREKDFGRIERTKNVKNVMIIGAGPGGMEAARIAAMRGHRVTLFDRQERPGGQLQIAAKPPGKQKLLWFADYLAHQLKKLKVDVQLGVEVTADFVKAQDPDAVIVATGGRPHIPNIPGLSRSSFVTAWELLKDPGKVKSQKAIVIGGGVVGLETGEFLAERGNMVTIVEPLSVIAADMEPLNRKSLLDELAAKNVVILPGHGVAEVRDGAVLVLEGNKGKHIELEGDLVVLATGARPNRELVEALAGSLPIYPIGDCNKPRGIMAAVYEGAYAAVNI